jgi:hypothetical protein
MRQFRTALDIEGTTTAPVWSVSVAAFKLIKTWLLNPLCDGATLQEYINRFTCGTLFPRAFRASTGCELADGVLRRNMGGFY